MDMPRDGEGARIVGFQAAYVALVLAIGCSSTAGGASMQSSALRGSPVELTVLTYNVLYQYRQVPGPDGSYPEWVCRDYPYVVDHPELRWPARRHGVFATLARERADIIALQEMRGGRPAGATEHATAVAASDGPDLMGDVTRWLEGAGYEWLWAGNVSQPVEMDAVDQRDWEESTPGGTEYRPAADDYSSFSFLAYRADRLELSESGAFELPTSSPRDRRFAVWGVLRDRRSGRSLLASSMHFDAFSGAHRVESARRLSRLVERHRALPAVLMGDLNSTAGIDDECERVCSERAARVCRAELLARCQGDSVLGVLSQAALMDVFARSADAPPSTALRLEVGAGTWSGTGRCRPSSRSRPGEPRLGALRVVPTGRRVDHILASLQLRVVRAEVVTPVSLPLEVDGEPREILPSDHLPVVARLAL